MENSLQNLGTKKKNIDENIIQSNNINPEAPKSILENERKKLVPLRKAQ